MPIGVILAIDLLIDLTGPRGQVILLNPETVVTVRTPRGHDHFAQGSRCLVNTLDGKFVAVQESCMEVRRRIEASRR